MNKPTQHQEEPLLQQAHADLSESAAACSLTISIYPWLLSDPLYSDGQERWHSAGASHTEGCLIET